MYSSSLLPIIIVEVLFSETMLVCTTKPNMNHKFGTYDFLICPRLYYDATTILTVVCRTDGFKAMTLSLNLVAKRIFGT
jgi:hypothetical protein